MTVLSIPVRPITNQSLQVQVDNQPCTIDLSQTNYGLFMTLYLDADLIVASVLCQNRNRIVRSAYLGFSGDFVFVDTQGNSDPAYEGLGDRYQLVWLSSDTVNELL